MLEVVLVRTISAFFSYANLTEFDVLSSRLKKKFHLLQFLLSYGDSEELGQQFVFKTVDS